MKDEKDVVVVVASDPESKERIGLSLIAFEVHNDRKEVGVVLLESLTGKHEERCVNSDENDDADDKQ